MKRSFFLLLITFFYTISLYSQTNLPVIVKSTNIQKVDNKNYYIHTVQKGQTLYSISRAYEVTVDQILTDNPDAKNGLKPETNIKIPIVEKVVQKSIFDETAFDRHIVIQKETLYGIAKQYSIPVEELIYLNPFLKDGLKVGQVLMVPKISNIPEKNYFYHTVEQKETLYKISKKYDVTIEELTFLNPELKDGLKIGQNLKIPSSVYAKQNFDDNGNLKKPLIQEQHIQKTDTINDLSYNPKLKKENYNIALLLPFYSEEIDSIDTKQPNLKGYTSNRSLKFIQFYEGILLALDSAKSKGFNAKLYVYDITEDSLKTNEILKKPEFKKMDLILGPVFYESLIPVVRFAKKHKIKVVSPLSSNTDILYDNDNVFCINPTNYEQFKFLAKYISRNFKDENIIMIHNNRDSEKQSLDSLRSYLTQYLHHTNKINEVIYFTEGINGVKQKLTNKKKNILLTFINGEAMVANFVTQLNEFRGDTVMIMFGLPNWSSFENIEPEYFFHVNLHLYTSSFIDFSTDNVKSFVNAFRERFYTEPEKFAFRGFDVGNMFFNALYLYGTDFDKCINKLNINTLETNFDFNKHGRNGFENHFVLMQKYEDYKLIKITDN